MRTSKQITLTVLAATLVAAGCSKKDETYQPRTAESQPTVRVTPASITDVPHSTQPVVPGPVTFADGETAYNAGKYADATKIFEQYTAQKPENAWGHFMLGLSAWKSGDLQKAETALEDSLRIDPEHLKSLVNLSRVLLDQRRFDDALVRLTEAGKIDPNSADVQRLLGRTYSGQGKTDDAISAYRAAIMLDNGDAWSMNNLGLLLLEQGRTDDALPFLARAVQLKKDVAMFQNNLGMALEHTGRYTAAATAYHNALAADPKYAKAEKNLTRVEAVKSPSEEPFDLEAVAGRVVEQTQHAAVETPNQ